MRGLQALDYRLLQGGDMLYNDLIQDYYTRMYVLQTTEYTLHSDAAGYGHPIACPTVMPHPLLIQRGTVHIKPLTNMPSPLMCVCTFTHLWSGSLCKLHFYSLHMTQTIDAILSAYIIIYVVSTHSWSMHAHLGCQCLCTP